MDPRFELYMQMLLEWNQKINLTAITDPEEIKIKHFADSLTCIESGYIPQNASVVDVGTGAGFPGIPIKLKREDITLTLMDSLNKRILFLKEVTSRLGIRAECLHIRGEDAGRDPAYRERYDLAVSRAVANLSKLSEYCLPLVKVGGCLLAMKGREVQQEIEEADRLIQALGGKVKEVQLHTLPDTDITHSIVVVEKTKPTPKRFPRAGKKIGIL